LRMIELERMQRKDRAHFFAMAATLNERQKGSFGVRPRFR
jgi:hypothetical protein